MRKQSTYYTRFVRRMIPTLILMVGLTGLFGCSGTYGRLAVNSDVKDLFERNEILPDHRYFHSGLAPHPRAIIGLHKDYSLQSEYWTPVALTPDMLHQWLTFQGRHNQYVLGNNGSDILDAEGRNIGILYGLRSANDWVVVKMIGDKTVNITLPMPQKEFIRPLFRRPY